jgi:phosphoribosylamine--glycine ligase
MAAHNYPETPRKGDLITGLPRPGSSMDAVAEAVVFHAGTVREGNEIRTAGGRVLCVTALGDSVKMAQRNAYDLLEPVRFDGMQFRRDIGYRAIAATSRGAKGAS